MRGVTCPVHLHAKTVVVTWKRVNVLGVKMDILARHATSVSTDVDIQNQIHSIISFIMQFTCQYYNNSYIILSLKKKLPHGKYTKLGESGGVGVSHWHICFSLLHFSSSGECFQIAFLITNLYDFVNFNINIFLRRTIS